MVIVSTSLYAVQISRKLENLYIGVLRHSAGSPCLGLTSGLGHPIGNLLEFLGEVCLQGCETFLHMYSEILQLKAPPTSPASFATS